MNKSALLITATALAAASSAFAQIPTPPSTSTSTYLEPTAAGWSALPLLTVGDSVTNSGASGGSYRMVGIPDGLGAYSTGGTVTILMNHELGGAAGIARAHGSTGAFVSEWTLEKNTLAITSGKDLIQSAASVFTWNGGAFQAGTTSFNRLCSADLPSQSAFFDSGSSTGYNGRIFMNGEEAGANGRAWAFVATGSEAGKAYELPKLGKFSWENSVARPTAGATTAVVGLDDSTPGQVYLYVGTKTASGNAVEQAGLHNGTLYGIKVAGVTTETAASHNTTGVSGSFTLAPIDTTVDGNTQQAAAVTAGVTEFARPEDGQWVDADTFVFVTTGANGNSAKLYKLEFSDANNLAAGGSVSMILDAKTLTGADGQIARSFDNLTVGADGTIYIQEDPGNAGYSAKVWAVDANNPLAAVQILQSDTDRFGGVPTGPGTFTSATAPFTQDEEHSGIIDVTHLFDGTEGDAASWYVPGTQLFLTDTQAHYGIAGELVEGGQLQLIVDTTSAIPEPSTYAALAGLAGLALAASRRRRV